MVGLRPALAPLLCRWFARRSRIPLIFSISYRLCWRDTSCPYPTRLTYVQIDTNRQSVQRRLKYYASACNCLGHCLDLMSIPCKCLFKDGFEGATPRDCRRGRCLRVTSMPSGLCWRHQVTLRAGPLLNSFLSEYNRWSSSPGKFARLYLSTMIRISIQSVSLVQKSVDR